MLHALGEHIHRDLLQAGAIHLTRFSGVAAEQTRLEHFQRGDGQPLAARKDLAGFLGPVGPRGASTSVQENGDNKEVDETARAFLRIDGAGPRLQQLVDTGAAAHIKVLPAAVRGDRLIVGRIVSLSRRKKKRALGRWFGGVTQDATRNSP